MLSDKQIMFRDYLIKKLGFIDDYFLSVYLNQLETSASKYKYLGALPEVFETIKTDEGKIIQRLKNSDSFKIYEKKRDLWVPNNYNIFDFLNYEYKIKKELIFNPKINLTAFISATDISNFTYCPVSLSISKTFDLVKIESAYIGIDLHEDKRLINHLPSLHSKNAEKNSFNESQLEFITSDNEEFFKVIENSTLIYNGHNNENERRYFKSARGFFVGQPDYIFQDSNNKFFVVEEKFQFQKTNENLKEVNFHDNHINQVASYLYGIPDYEIDYGYLIYWKFDWNYGTPFIHSCHVKKIVKDEKIKNSLVSIYKQLREFLTHGILSFDIDKRNASKCANCVSNILCGHKTGKYTNITYPYSVDFLTTHFVELPKELKKGYVSEEELDEQKTSKEKDNL